MITASTAWEILVTAALASFAISVLIVMSQRWHGSLSLDHDLDGVQKFHTTPVPRIGGVAIFFGMLSALLICIFFAGAIPDENHGANIGKLMVASLPAFLSGVFEDITKKISPRFRLIATMSSALLASWLLGATLDGIDIVVVDTLLKFAPIALIVTVITVAGGANAINIIDGFNGLAASAVIIMSAALGWLAWQAGDVFVAELALLGAGATAGFLLVNYPTGRMFMGDGGAYFSGFWLGEAAVLLLIRNPSVSAWQVLAICAYPVIEVLYSMYRRKVVRKSSPGAPDCLHLHTLIYRRVVCQIVPRNENKPWLRNAVVACFTVTWITVVAIVTICFGNTHYSAIAIVAAQVLIYLAIYTRLVRLRWHMHPLAMFGLWQQQTESRPS